MERLEISGSTFSVFLALIRGYDTPRKISQFLGLSEGAVVSHLNVLRAMGLAQRLEKRGASQPYAPKFEPLIEALISTLVPPTKNGEAIEKFVESTESSEKLAKLIEAGLKTLPISSPIVIYTLTEFLQELPRAIMRVGVNPQGDPTFTAFLNSISPPPWSLAEICWAVALNSLGLANTPPPSHLLENLKEMGRGIVVISDGSPRHLKRLQRLKQVS